MTLKGVKTIAAGLCDDLKTIRPKSVTELDCDEDAFGYCDSEGNIQIRLKTHKRPDRPLARSTVVRVLCHEMAHLAEFNHGRSFELLERVMIAWAKRRKLI